MPRGQDSYRNCVLLLRDITELPLSSLCLRTREEEARWARSKVRPASSGQGKCFRIKLVCWRCLILYFLDLRTVRNKSLLLQSTSLWYQGHHIIQYSVKHKLISLNAISSYRCIVLQIILSLVYDFWMFNIWKLPIIIPHIYFFTSS